MTPASALPLIAIDAAVIDTETTGLEPGKARIVEVAAIRLVRGRLDLGSPFHSLVRPDISIPEVATHVHGIDDERVAAAPPFSGVWADLSGYVGQAILIGHTIGFDLTVLRLECERARIRWSAPPALDTRLLAEIAEPNLAGYSLENLAAWLGVMITDRHSALGDAITTARIFTALVPKLRDVGVHTLAEAIKACQSLTSALEAQHRAGWTAPSPLPATAGASAPARFDTYPYRHRVSQLMSVPAKFVTPDTTIGTALDQMARQAVSSLFVAAKGGSAPTRPQETGIVTERDVLRALAAQGASALAAPVAGRMSKPLATVPADSFVYAAIARMNRLKVRHLGVTDASGNVVGALSARDLLRVRRESALSLDDELDHAEDVHDLGRAWARLPQVAASLVAEEISAREVAAVISNMLGSLTRHAAIIGEQRMQNDGHGAAPCPYALAVLGSAGREESLLAMDQDNAIVFAEGEPGGEHDKWFAALGTHVADILHAAGVPYCRGGVMAKNSEWRGSLATWKARIEQWVRRSKPEDLLSVDIFFDLRGVHGDAALADHVWRMGFETARGQVEFAKLLAESAGPVEPSLGLLGGFKTKEGRIDLKKAGLFGIVSTARVLAVCHHVVERSTVPRLAGVKAIYPRAQGDLDAIADAQGSFLRFLLGQQIEDIAHGVPASNAVQVARLPRRDRDELRAALHAVAHLDELTRNLLFAK